MAGVLRWVEVMTREGLANTKHMRTHQCQGRAQCFVVLVLLESEQSVRAFGNDIRPADRSNVGQRKRSSLEIIGAKKPLRAQCLQTVELGSDLKDGSCLAILDRRHKKATWRLHRERDVVLGLQRRRQGV